MRPANAKEFFVPNPVDISDLPAPGTTPRPVNGADKSARRPVSDLVMAARDAKEALNQSWFWLSLGWNDIVQRYRGSILGPFWLTITTAVFIGGLGPLYAGIFGLAVESYLPSMAVGVLIWGFISSVMTESCRAFIDAAPIMKQVRLPRMTILLHMLWRNVIIFAHNLPVLLGVSIYCAVPVNANLLAVVPGFVLLMLNLTWIAVLLAIVCLRYRDVVQIVSSVLLLGFFVTPVMWNPKLQSVPAWIVYANPFAAFIEIVRAPLLGLPIEMASILMAIGSLLVGGTAAALLFARARKQLIYWA
jgi:ABC-type polysaccharide/polyol phosphate export permease